MAMMRVGLDRKVGGAASNFQRCIHSISQQPIFGTIMSPSPSTSPPLVLPEPDDTNIVHGFLELMATVPKKRTTHHKKGIRNGPKFLKPAPVIHRCTVCGRVKLPHFFCCSGIKDDNGRQG